MSGQEYLVLGVQEDLDELLDDFIKKNSTKYEDFTSVWKERCFDCIFMGKPHTKQMKFFTEKILIMAKNMVLKSTKQNEQIGSMYLLYALYFVQPLKERESIRIEANEWKYIFNFCSLMKNEPYNEWGPFLCLWKLHKITAFHYVMQTSYFVGELPDCILQESSNNSQQNINLDQFFNENGFSLNEWIEAEKQYNAEKQKLLDENDFIIKSELQSCNPEKLLEPLRSTSGQTFSGPKYILKANSYFSKKNSNNSSTNNYNNYGDNVSEIETEIDDTINTAKSLNILDDQDIES